MPHGAASFRRELSRKPGGWSSPPVPPPLETASPSPNPQTKLLPFLGHLSYDKTYLLEYFYNQYIFLDIIHKVRL